MQIAEVISPKLEAPQQPDYTWRQTWRFMFVGIVKALWWSSSPVATYIYMYWWEIPFPWRKGLAVASAVWGPTLAKYCKGHWHLLKLPPILDAPAEFEK